MIRFHGNFPNFPRFCTLACVRCLWGDVVVVGGVVLWFGGGGFAGWGNPSVAWWGVVGAVGVSVRSLVGGGWRVGGILPLLRRAGCARGGDPSAPL